MNKLLKYGILAIGICLLFYLDFIRDYIFKNIGFQIFYLQHLSAEGFSSVENYTDSFLEKYIKNYSIKDLTSLKWASTVFFSILFGVVGATINGFFYQTKKVSIYFLLLYALIFVSSFIIYLGIYLSDSFVFQNKAYLISMELAHFIQSSLPTLLFLVSFNLYQQNKN